MKSNLEDPFYYLNNFRFVLDWVLQRSRDLLDQGEIDFIDVFSTAPVQSQALLVRMIMRSGDLFRSSKLVYEEIGDIPTAAHFLIEQNWVHVNPSITVEQLYGVVTKTEFVQALGMPVQKAAKKIELLAIAQRELLAPRCYTRWNIRPAETLYQLSVGPLCDRIRLMFFGNLHQDWSEFVVAELGILTYEKVAFSEASRAFHSRHDINIYLLLHTCREALHKEEPLEQIERAIDEIDCSNQWLERQKAKLLFRIGQEYERREEWGNALKTFARCEYSGARLRRIRVMEKAGQIEHALNLAESALASPQSDAEIQHLTRMMPRLQRRLALSRPLMTHRATPKAAIPRIDLVLPRPSDGFYVEDVVRLHLEQTSKNTPVYYVENTLINSLFGLLCWDAIFCAVPGAFFHPFQVGPADLHSPDFPRLRAPQFKHALSQLESHQYKQTIRENFRRKSGIQSPFVHWGMLSETLLEHAFQCFPANHLSTWFGRILDDIATNRSGFPDLIQFWPDQGRYQMIEIKGPGDRLQDNQIRFLHFCLTHDMPVAVCHVEWEAKEP